MVAGLREAMALASLPSHRWGGGVACVVLVVSVASTEGLPQDKAMAHSAHLMCRCTCGTCLQQLPCMCVDAKQ